ncbi:23S rRNA (uracil(1939)-C(5))-methyltransferase RlmD [Candidatus Peregrinibacteria bacterium]|nr:23S rRNA (uracil(1939)-C(5))-methyltransferase RlmD [Candidatus Peregrinibacteria bacterium]
MKRFRIAAMDLKKNAKVAPPRRGANCLASSRWAGLGLVELTIMDLAFGGAGVAKLGNLTVFVERAVPGDKILARLTKIKSSYAEAKLEKLVVSSPERVGARCKHFGVCGGCSLQNLNYENQLKWKWKMVSDAICRIGGFREAKIEPIIGCSSPWFYRNKMEYSFGARQQSDVGGQMSDVNLGLHPSGNFREIFDLEECFLQSELSVKIARSVRQWAQKNNLNTDVLRNLIIREGKNTEEVMVNLVTHGENFPLEKDFAQFAARAFPQITSLYRTAITVQRGKRTVIKEFHLSGKPHLTETLSIPTGKKDAPPVTLHFEIAPQAFFQPNTLQAEVLYRKILEFASGPLAPHPSLLVLDLFCGTGTIGMALSKTCKNVIGVETNEAAVQNAQKNAEKNNIKNIEFMCGDVGKILTYNLQLTTNNSILVTDPPRAGIEPKTLQKILALKIPKWIYVSCNPTTLARDLKIICENGYELQKIQPVDMFPHTYHVETVCLLSNTR